MTEKRLCPSCQKNPIPDKKPDGWICDECYQDISRSMSEGMFVNEAPSKES